MPRTKLQESIPDSDQLRKLIEKRLVEIEMDKQDAAKSIGMPRVTFSRKLESGGWTYPELFDLFTVIKLPNVTILKAFGRS